MGATSPVCIRLFFYKPQHLVLVTCWWDSLLPQWLLLFKLFCVICFWSCLFCCLYCSAGARHVLIKAKFNSQRAYSSPSSSSPSFSCHYSEISPTHFIQRITEAVWHQASPDGQYLSFSAMMELGGWNICACVQWWKQLYSHSEDILGKLMASALTGWLNLIHFFQSWNFSFINSSSICYITYRNKFKGKVCFF